MESHYIHFFQQPYWPGDIRLIDPTIHSNCRRLVFWGRDGQPLFQFPKVFIRYLGVKGEWEMLQQGVNLPRGYLKPFEEVIYREPDTDDPTYAKRMRALKLLLHNPKMDAQFRKTEAIFREEVTRFILAWQTNWPKARHPRIW